MLKWGAVAVAGLIFLAYYGLDRATYECSGLITKANRSDPITLFIMTKENRPWVLWEHFWHNALLLEIPGTTAPIRTDVLLIKRIGLYLNLYRYPENGFKFDDLYKSSRGQFSTVSNSLLHGHGVPWGSIEMFANCAKPSNMMWFGAEEAECWGFMRWSAGDTSNDDKACYLWVLLTDGKRKPEEVSAKNANVALSRINAGTSSVYVSTDRSGQGFSTAYRKACEPIAADPETPKYAAIDIILWLTLTYPDFLDQKPATLMVHILDNDSSQVDNCWKCFTIMGISFADHEHVKDGLECLRKAVKVVKRHTGSVPAWLTNRVDVVAAGAAKQKSPIRGSCDFS